MQMQRKRNPYNDAHMMGVALQQIKQSIHPHLLAYIGGQVSTLGGAHRPTILLRVSLLPKDEWKNGIFENSPYAHISIGSDGVMEMFGGCIIPKLRKTRVTSTEEVIKKLCVWASKALSVHMGEPPS